MSNHNYYHNNNQPLSSQETDQLVISPSHNTKSKSTAELVDQLNNITTNHSHNLFTLNIFISLCIELENLANTLSKCAELGRSTIVQERIRLLKLANILGLYTTAEGKK